MKKQVTIKDMSKVLGISISTISKALNDSCEISDKTKAIVKKAAIAHNYVPNYFAKSLRTSPTNIMGITISQNDESNSVQLMEDLIKTPQLKNYKHLLYQYNKDLKNPEFLKKMIKGNIAGIIVLISE